MFDRRNGGTHRTIGGGTHVIDTTSRSRCESKRTVHSMTNIIIIIIRTTVMYIGGTTGRIRIGYIIIPITISWMIISSTTG